MTYRRHAHRSEGETVQCRECGGTGKIENDEYKGKCLRCDGLGQVVIANSQPRGDETTIDDAIQELAVRITQIGYRVDGMVSRIDRAIETLAARVRDLEEAAGR